MTDPHRWRGDGAWMRLNIQNRNKVSTEKEGERTANGVEIKPEVGTERRGRVCAQGPLKKKKIVVFSSFGVIKRDQS